MLLPSCSLFRDRLFLCFVLLAGLLVAKVGVRTAAAQSGTPSNDMVHTARETLPLNSAERKSPGWALSYSLGGTALLTPVFGIGLLVGPSFGHFYAEAPRRAWRGIGLRGAGMAGTLVLAEHAGDLDEMFGVLGTGALLVLVYALFDSVTAWHSAKDYNESHGLSAQIAPTVAPHGEQAGLALRVSF